MANVRCFTLRLPPDLYIELFDASEAKGKTLNATACELIRVGLRKQMDIRAGLQQLIDREFGLDAVSTEG